ncbi:tripartite tricarboxylate transporter substrate binding protein [Roseomonas terrae]|jgi:tripartite-type tricarboxylate transporter receptor subunit TctC|uniref:Tripartite tricarboxylate transporter substrate binding protein n=1 Tax=Neoroseomonas terrae TaxID=424799 RepID=A0ABS5EBD9_9PROT|nr:tripartite tricarboxylate transporter substrate binding protein [Neoroseomonas terrae]MBR0648340.1 tripartite tricarboxylate transporter substrate binding protein [Neoroseomonas terrae]
MVQVSRRIAAALAVLGGFLALSSPVRAQDAYPSRPVRIIVSFAAGGGADIMARLLAVPLARELGQPVVVENRGGGGGVIGTEACARSPADGYTLCFGSTTTHSIIPHLQQGLTWDALRDFTAITNLGFQPNVLAVTPALPIRNMAELIEWAKRNRGAAYGTSGVGTSNHLAGEYLSRQFDLALNHVAYRGGNLAQQDAAGGQIPIVIDQITAMLPLIQAGRLRPIVVAGSRGRSALLPDVPNITEATLPDFRVESYQALFGPAGLPPAVLARIHDAVVKAVNNSDVRQRFIEMGTEPVLNTPTEFAAYLRDTSPMYQRLVEISGARVN